MKLANMLDALGRAVARWEFDQLRELAAELTANERSDFMEAWLMVAAARGVQVQ